MRINGTLAMAFFSLFGITGLAQCAAPALTFHSHNRVAFGFVVDAPKQLLGVNFYAIRADGGLSIYLDYKRPLTGRVGGDHYYDNISKYLAGEVFGDKLIESGREWNAVNFATTKAISGRVAVYGGIGVSWAEGFCEYYDRMHILGDDGHYWIEDKDGSGTYMNALVGAIVLANNNLTVQVGVELQPQGITVGVAYARPSFTWPGD